MQATLGAKHFDYICEVRRREAARCAGKQTTQPPIRVAFLLAKADFLAKQDRFCAFDQKIHFIVDFLCFSIDFF